MGKKRQNQLSLQYFLSYLLVVGIVMGMLMIFVYSSFYRFHSEIHLSDCQNSLERIRQSHERALEDLITVTGQLENLTEARPFSFREEPAKAPPLIERIAQLLSTSRTVYGVYLYYYGEDFLYSSTSSYTLDNFTRRAAVFENMSAEEMLHRLEHTNQFTVLPMQGLASYAFGVNQYPVRVVPVLMPFSYVNAKNVGTIMFFINEATYLDWFASHMTQDADVYITSAVNGSQLLVSHNVTGVPWEVVEAAKGDTLRYEGRRYHVLRADGVQMPQKYLMLVSDNGIRGAMSASTPLILLIAALTAAAGVLLSMRLVQSRVRPIMLLHSMISDKKPSGNELIEIRDSVQRLIDENRSMQNRLNQLDTLERSDFARAFLIGGFASKDAYLSRAEEIQLNVDVRCYAVAILAKPADSGYDLSPHKMLQLFQPPVDGVARATGTDGTRLIVIAFSDDGDALMDFLESKLVGMRSVCPGLTMAVSGLHSDYEEGQRAYLEAERAFEMRFFEGNSRIIRFDRQAEQDDGVSGYSQQLTEELRVALRMRDAKQLNIALNDIARVTRSIHPSLFVFRCLYNDILNIVSSEARQIGSEDRLYDLFKLSQCLSIDDLDAMLREACKLVVSGRQPTGDSVVARARELIAQRFSEPDLSIAAIAEEVGLSDTKLSGAFRRAYQMTPTDYLLSLRMHRARHLLRTTGMLVRDIAIECGYYDISGFNRRFKAYTGLTPQQYRQSCAAGGESNEEETP